MVDVPDHESGLITIAGNLTGQNHHFAVESYDENNKLIDLLVNTTEEYQGTRLFDPDGRKPKRLKITATGLWAVEILPVGRMRHEVMPGVITGKNDDVILLMSGTPDTAKIAGNLAGRFFAILAYPSAGPPQLLVNTTEPYVGTVLMPTDTILLEVRATGEWSIDVTTK